MDGFDENPSSCPSVLVLLIFLLFFRREREVNEILKNLRPGSLSVCVCVCR